MVRSRFSKRLYPTIFGLLLVTGVLWAQLTHLPLMRQAVQRLDSLVYDLRLKATLKQQAPDPRIVIVDIDEKSLKAEGHWPWTRDKIANLVNSLFEQGATVVGFDIVFAEAERNSGRMVLQRLLEAKESDPQLTSLLRQHINLFDNNAVLAKQVRDRDVVLGYIFHNRGEQNSGDLPLALQVDDPPIVARLAMNSASSYTGNIDVLQKAARYGGFFSLEPDTDGIIRRAPVVLRYHDKLYPSLALEVARRFLLIDKVGLQVAQVGDSQVLEGLRLGRQFIPTDSAGQVIVPYRGLWGSFPYVSATDVLHRHNHTEQKLQGAIVLIGTTAQGLFDLRATPIQPVYPGVEVHANIIAGILDNSFPMEPAWATGADFLVTLCVGLLLALLLPRLEPLSLVLISSLVLAAVIAFNFWLWSSEGLILSLAPQLLLILTVATLNMAYGFLTEFRGKRQLQGMFGQYVPPELVKVMSESPDQYGFEGESREMTVLFADIRSFTTISEALTANTLKDLLNRFFTPMTRIIFENRGTIDKYVGDMVMAFWGAPVADEEHAAHGIAAALAMLQEVERLKPEFRAAGLPEVEIGIGINTGPMNVGDMGSKYRRAYTVLGDSVNLASRLEGTTRYYGVNLVVGEQTRSAAGDRFLYRELDLIRVKGKAQAIRVFQPLCLREQATPEIMEELQQYETALNAYRQQQWERAEELFAALHSAHPDGVCGIYLERIAALKATPPDADWDGVYERKEK